RVGLWNACGFHGQFYTLCGLDLFGPFFGRCVTGNAASRLYIGCSAVAAPLVNKFVPINLTSAINHFFSSRDFWNGVRLNLDFLRRGPSVLLRLRFLLSLPVLFHQARAYCCCAYFVHSPRSQYFCPRRFARKYLAAHSGFRQIASDSAFWTRARASVARTFFGLGKTCR